MIEDGVFAFFILPLLRLGNRKAHDCRREVFLKVPFFKLHLPLPRAEVLGQYQYWP